MAYQNNSAASRNNNTSSSNAGEAPERNIGGYLNIGVRGRDGQVRRLGQGGRGISLREDHPVEGAVLEFLRAQGVDALTDRLVITFGDAKALENFEL
ncbi:hypothetical protein ACUND2_22520 [Serratia sp. IR-2025]